MAQAFVEIAGRRFFDRLRPHALHGEAAFPDFVFITAGFDDYGLFNDFILLDGNDYTCFAGFHHVNLLTETGKQNLQTMSGHGCNAKIPSRIGSGTGCHTQVPNHGSLQALHGICIHYPAANLLRCKGSNTQGQRS